MQFNDHNVRRERLNGLALIAIPDVLYQDIDYNFQRMLRELHDSM